MSPVRSLAILSLAAAVVLTASGCKQRGRAAASYGDSASSDTAAEYKERYEMLRDERTKDHQSGTVGDQAREIGIGEIPGLTQSNGRVSLGEDFAFERGSAKLNSEGRKAIEKLALRLNDGDNANGLVVVEGHTDDKPVSRQETIDRYGDNWGLSAARSASVVRALQKAGIDAKRLRGAFRGPYAPVSQGGKDDNSANRRVEIYVTK